MVVANQCPSIQIGETVSNIKFIWLGVLQGSVFVHFVFIRYINDIVMYSLYNTFLNSLHPSLHTLIYIIFFY